MSRTDPPRSLKPPVHTRLHHLRAGRVAGSLMGSPGVDKLHIIARLDGATDDLDGCCGAGAGLARFLPAGGWRPVVVVVVDHDT